MGKRIRKEAMEYGMTEKGFRCLVKMEFSAFWPKIAEYAKTHSKAECGELAKNWVKEGDISGTTESILGWHLGHSVFAA